MLQTRNESLSSNEYLVPAILSVPPVRDDDYLSELQASVGHAPDAHQESWRVVVVPGGGGVGKPNTESP